MAQKIIYRDYRLNEFCWWSYTDKGKQEFMSCRSAMGQVKNGDAILIDTPEAHQKMMENIR